MAIEARVRGENDTFSGISIEVGSKGPRHSSPNAIKCVEHPPAVLGVVGKSQCVAGTGSDIGRGYRCAALGLDEETNAGPVVAVFH